MQHNVTILCRTGLRATPVRVARGLLSGVSNLTEQDTGHVTLISLISLLGGLITLITLITVSIVRISLVYRKTRSLLCSYIQLIVYSDYLVYNNTKPLL